MRAPIIIIYSFIKRTIINSHAIKDTVQENNKNTFKIV